jgi:ribosomal-protein-serine acetyltransferase
MFYLAIDQDIQVRTFHPDDSETLFHLVERNRSRLRPWIHVSALPETLADARKLTVESFLNSHSGPFERRQIFQSYMQELEEYFPPLNPPMEMGIWAGESLIGEIMLGRLQDNFTAAEFGYWIDEEREGQGIITRCVSGLMDYAIDNMGMERFIIGCAADNRRSSAIPERLGYRLLARIPDGEVVGDFVYDRLIYEMRSSDWRERDSVKVTGSAAV